MIQYTSSHEWAKIEATKAIIGISAYAQKELGDVVFIQLPEVGQLLKKEEEAVILESTKAAVDVYSPLSGTVLSVNEELLRTPSLVNSSAEDLGWLFTLELSHPEETKELLDKRQYDHMTQAGVQS